MTKKQNSNLKSEKGLSYIEVMVAIVILTIGILAQISALTFSVLRVQENELRTGARQAAASTLESIFAARELGSTTGIDSWDKIDISTSSANGIFRPGWHYVREDPGADGVIGTADDACGFATSCSSAGGASSGSADTKYERKIEITSMNNGLNQRVRKKRIEITVRYWIGNIPRNLVIATMIADLPINE